MAKYDISYSCGHTDTVNIIGRDRERRIRFLEAGLCFDCYKIQRRQEAQAQSEERELPPLQGSEKQVAWAMTIRVGILKRMERMIEQEMPPFSEDESRVEAQRRLTLALDALYKEPSAKRWIEWRDCALPTILREVYQTLRAAPTHDEIAQRQQEALAAAQQEAVALAEATIRPERPVTETVAEISIVAPATVRMHFPEHHEGFRGVVKGLGYIWSEADHAWLRRLSVARNGSASDRAIELGHTLLSHGFCVRCFDADLRAAMAAGTFAPEHTRWITTLIQGEYVGWFALLWGKQEDYYEVARRLRGSRYSAPFVVVPPTSFAYVLDFAERYDFRLTMPAQTIASQAREQREQMVIARKARPDGQSGRTVASIVPPVLAIPEQVEVDEEFSDADDH